MKHQSDLYSEPSYPPVLTKRDFVRRFMKDEFGNKGPNWDTLDEFLASNYKGLVHIRNRVVGGPTFYDVAWYDVKNQYETILRHGIIEQRNIYLAGMAPTEKTLIQGELQRAAGGLYLFYSTVAKPMRDALRESSLLATGLTAQLIVQHYLCDLSYDWLMLLLERYPDHVVEFSTYGVNWGTIPNMNTVFWEVRNY